MNALLRWGVELESSKLKILLCSMCSTILQVTELWYTRSGMLSCVLKQVPRVEFARNR